MFLNYLKIAWRNMLKNRFYSVLNISGLAIGITAFLFITIYVADELSYDRYHDNASRIYRIAQHGSWDGGNFDITGTSAPFAEALKRDNPEVEDAVRFDVEGGGTVSYGDKHLQVNDISFADASVFNVFTYRFLSGDPKTALARPASIVITRTLAENLFGSAAAAINKSVSFGPDEQNLVTGVIADVPENSHFRFSALRSFPANFTEDWGYFHLYTYILLKKNADIHHLEQKLPQFYNKYLKDLGKGTSSFKYRMELQPLTSIHLHSNLGYELSSNGSMKYIYSFSLIALLILIIASINYINLATARSYTRVKEIAVRKVNGSGRSQLIAMFLSESVLFVLGASAMAIVAMYLAAPIYTQLTDKRPDFNQLLTLKNIVVFVLFICATGIITGLYPALFFSSFKTINALKGEMGNKSGGNVFRRSLIIVQFTISICMIVGSMIIYRQLNFIQNKNLGFNKNQVLTIHLENRDLRNRVNELRNKLLQNPDVQQVATAGNPIGNNDIGGTEYKTQTDNNSAAIGHLAKAFTIDEDFIPALQIKLAEGRNFSKDMPTDSSLSVIVNETLVKESGWNTGIGKKIQLGDAHSPFVNIIGVTKDFNIFSLQHKIEPLILTLPRQQREKDNLYIRISNQHVGSSLKYIENVFKGFDNQHPFIYHFLDENFAKQYKAEQKQGFLLTLFTLISVVISCLGLLGLVTFNIYQRTKEIGIRKVLGANVTDVVKMLSVEFIKLVTVSFIIAVPISWWAMNNWLQDFAYRVNISWWIFALAGMLAVFIAFATVSFQAIKAALANPVRSLRTE
ncbi:FtsX-like permease family protein [Pedobacter sp. HMF7647]|uniref:FtsX-like permease family protein n=1 Tax=Hufsiella arboris TaxID=2695275 RepID=A0A7K1YA67_9SPHI|nr:ABC transporter permease [Hufsiella arboris]MXV51473.1 FtsX-like permease family protein [Hufsiella arboris]